MAPMPEFVMPCPGCQAPMKFAEPVRWGQRVRCRSCGTVFTVGAEAGRLGPQPAARAEGDDLPRPRRKKKGTKAWLGIGLGCGALTALICGGLVWGVVRMMGPTKFPEQTEDYAEARAKFQTKLIRQGPAPQRQPRERPPPGVREIEYQSGGLRLKAWVDDAPPPGGARKPAVLFLHGGFAFGADDWDQARPFRDAGFVTMTPMLRGENGLPGAYSMFYSEVDDVLAAADALAALTYVDPNRLYVSGHSAGGTLTLLAAMTSKRFRAAGSFSGSPDQVAFARGQAELVPFNPSDSREFQMRSPAAFPRSFKCPVRLYYGRQEFLFSSTSQRTAQLAKAAGLDVEAVSVPGDHFTSVDPAMRQCVAFFQQK
jgi:dienelactone hydrolase